MKIQPYVSQEYLPTRQRGAPYMDMGSALTTELESAGNQLLSQGLTLNKQMATARRQADLADLETRAAVGLDELEFQAMKNPDYRQSPGIYKDGAIALHDKLLEGVEDPIVKQMFGNSYLRLAASKSINVRKDAWARETDDQKANLDMSLDTYSKLMANAKNPAEKQAIDFQAQQGIAGAVAAGWITKVQGVNYLQKFQSSTAEVEVRQDLQDNAEQTLVNLLGSSAYPNLNPEKRMQLTTLAQNKVDADRLHAQVQADRAERQAEKAQKKAQAANEVAILDSIDRGQEIPPGQLGELARNQSISLEGYHFLRDQVHKAGEGDDNSMRIVQLQRDMADGKDIQAGIIEAINNKQITSGTARTLMNQNRELQGKQWKNTDQEFYFKFLTRMMGAEGMVNLSPDDSQQVAAAQSEYFERMKKGEDPHAVAVDISERYGKKAITLPVPRFSGTAPKDMNELNAQAIALAQKFKAGDIDKDAYNREVELLNNYKARIKRKEELDAEKAKGAQ